MTSFPQIGSGSIAQYPLQRGRKWRTISNTLENGERVILPDISAGQIEWHLSYQDLNDTEVQNLATLFAATQGRFGAFTFIDPLANLIGWSEDLSRPDWQSGLLQKQAGVADPVGTLRGSTVTNGTTGAQTLGQTLGVSGDYLACFSTYIRSNSPGTVTLQRDARQLSAPIGRTWLRIWISGPGTASATQSAFSIVIAAGQSIDVFGFQVEAQPYPSPYKQTAGALGIYEETYFATDELKVTNEGVGLSSCAVNLTSRV